MIETRRLLSPSDHTVAGFLLGILAVALGLRLWGINFALPYDFTPDEVHEVIRALKLGAGEYSWTPGKGGLHYFLFVEYGLLFIYWWIIGQVAGPTEFALQYLKDPSAFYLAGRMTVAVMGTLTCLVVFLIGKRLYDWRIGLAAAMIGATAHYHGLWSHYINVDIGMTLAVWTSILAYIVYEQNQRKRWLILAGVFCGIAFAFKLPGIVATLPIGLAIATASGLRFPDRQSIRQFTVVVFALLVTVTAVAPENVIGIGSVFENFASVLSDENDVSPAITENDADNEFDSSVREMTAFRGSANYLSILTRDTNIVLSVFALLGAAVGIWTRQRWDIIFGIFAIAFLTVMTAADRPSTERYMLPIVPALWLLGARGAAAVSKQSMPTMVGIVAVITAIPLYSLVVQNYTWTLPDTRVQSKIWIEEHVPADSKILMDGMRYRFIQSPPLLPNETTVARRVGGAANEDQLSRGVSSRTLDLYEKAMRDAEGPKYDLHSTVWGLQVEELSYYPQECFDYIVTSSDITKRFQAPSDEADHPESARFYRQLQVDPTFRKIFSAEPIAWQTQGPTITVYEVRPRCD